MGANRHTSRMLTRLILIFISVESGLSSSQKMKKIAIMCNVRTVIKCEKAILLQGPERRVKPCHVVLSYCSELKHLQEGIENARQERNSSSQRLLAAAEKPICSFLSGEVSPSSFQSRINREILAMI